MKNIELNYTKNEEDIQKFAENYYEHSNKIRKARRWSVLGALIISLIVAYPVHQIIEAGIFPYVTVVLILWIITPILVLREHRKDTFNTVNIKQNSENIGVKGHYKTILSDDEIHVTFLPNDPKREKNMTSKWQEIDYYSRDDDHFFIFMDKIDFVYHIVAGDKAEEVDHFLSQKMPFRNKKD